MKLRKRWLTALTMAELAAESAIFNKDVEKKIHKAADIFNTMSGENQKEAAYEDQGDIRSHPFKLQRCVICIRCSMYSKENMARRQKLRNNKALRAGIDEVAAASCFQ